MSGYCWRKINLVLMSYMALAEDEDVQRSEKDSSLEKTQQEKASYICTLRAAWASIQHV